MTIAAAVKKASCNPWIGRYLCFRLEDEVELTHLAGQGGHLVGRHLSVLVGIAVRANDLHQFLINNNKKK